jgi:hypothetical protein
MVRLSVSKIAPDFGCVVRLVRPNVENMRKTRVVSADGVVMNSVLDGCRRLVSGSNLGKMSLNEHKVLKGNAVPGHSVSGVRNKTK